MTRHQESGAKHLRFKWLGWRERSRNLVIKPQRPQLIYLSINCRRQAHNNLMIAQSYGIPLTTRNCDAKEKALAFSWNKQMPAQTFQMQALETFLNMDGSKVHATKRLAILRCILHVNRKRLLSSTQFLCLAFGTALLQSTCVRLEETRVSLLDKSRACTCVQ